MPALFLAVLAYETPAVGAARPHMSQTTLHAWSDSGLRALLHDYLEAHVDPAVDSGLLAAYDGRAVLEHLESGHIHTALATYAAGLATQGAMQLALSLTIHPMTPHRASLPIHVASSYFRDTPMVFLAVTEAELDVQLEHAHRTARHLERFVVPSLPPLPADPSAPTGAIT